MEKRALSMAVSSDLFESPDVNKLKTNKDINGLIKALGYQKDDLVSQNAAVALGEIGDALAVDPLITKLKDRDEDQDVRTAAAKALGKIGNSAVNPLIAVLTNSDNFANRAAAIALGEIGDARAIDPLIAVLKCEGHYATRETAANVLEKLGWKPDFGENGAWYWATKKDWEKCVALGIPAVNPLISILKATDNKNAAMALGEIGDARAVDPLIIALRCHDKSACIASAEALKKLYHRGKLDQKVKNKILAMRNVVTYHDDTHNDYTPNTSSSPGDCRHDDTHIDEGISVTL
jgi:HEAT repeat protein